MQESFELYDNRIILLLTSHIIRDFSYHSFRSVFSPMIIIPSANIIKATRDNITSK